jgi:hypothetical protein
VVRTPGPIDHLTLALDTAGRPPDSERRDHLFCHASLRDARGTLVAWENVAFGVTGAATLIGMNPYASEAGVSSILVERSPSRQAAAVHALALAPDGGDLRVVAASLGLTGRAPRHESRRTADGAELLVGGRVVASLAAGAPKFRIPVSAPPERRGPFRR